MAAGWSADAGVLLVATGERYLRMAHRTADSIRRVDGGARIALFTDLTDRADRALFDIVMRVDDAHRRSKVDVLPLTPFRRTLYLDVDTIVLGDLRPVLDLLEDHDLVVTHAHARNVADVQQAWRRPFPASYPQFNGGVLGYSDTPAARRIVEGWPEAFRAAGFKKDQVTLRELIHESGARFVTLPPEYNLRYPAWLRMVHPREMTPVVLHLALWKQIDARRLRDRLAYRRAVGRIRRDLRRWDLELPPSVRRPRAPVRG